MKHFCTILMTAATLATLFLADGFAQKADTFVQFETECLGTEGDGSVTLRAWGTGRNRADAVEQAKKNAVYDVIFKGITAGVSGCDPRPLVTEVNARERYEEYFNRFFTDGGEYTKFVSRADEKRFSKDKSKNKLGARYGVTVRVLRSELKVQLKADGIIK
ncbi:MAG: hypothetical protein E7070_12580 [Bacteroidales bacterium]|nr:hypothetical protein [Bacteroidales bacterium]